MREALSIIPKSCSDSAVRLVVSAVMSETLLIWRGLLRLCGAFMAVASNLTMLDFEKRKDPKAGEDAVSMLRSDGMDTDTGAYCWCAIE